MRLDISSNAQGAQLKDWTYEFISENNGSRCNAQFRPHGGLPQVQVFVIQQVTWWRWTASKAQQIDYVISNASDKQTLPPDPKKLDDVNPAKTENGGCLSMILVLVLAGSSWRPLKCFCQSTGIKASMSTTRLNEGQNNPESGERVNTCWHLVMD